MSGRRLWFRPGLRANPLIVFGSFRRVLENMVGPVEVLHVRCGINTRALVRMILESELLIGGLDHFRLRVMSYLEDSVGVPCHLSSP